MPYVLQPVLGSSIFLYGSEDDAAQGANWGGSGVLVGISSMANPSRVHLYAVTNAHVVEQCPVTRLVNTLREPQVLPGARSDWYAHPEGDDIAIRPLGALPDNAYEYVPNALLLSQDDLSPKEYPYQISPGDDCLMVGRYINQEFRQFDRPVVRFGNLAMLPERVHQRERSFDQESFLVDMRSQAGFSGSPVFLYYQAEGWRYLPPLVEAPETEDRVKDAEDLIEALKQRTRGRDASGVMSKTWLLGIDWGHLSVWDDVFDGNRKIGRMRVSTGMAGVVPAWKLTDLLNEEGMRMARDKVEEKLAEQNEAAAVLDLSTIPTVDPTVDLLGKLLQVPKSEADEVHLSHDQS